jgi:hypothetical protein
VSPAAGFGFPCVILTVLLPFHWGAAACNLLFPVFVLVACECEPLPRPGEEGSGARPSVLGWGWDGGCVRHVCAGVSMEGISRTRKAAEGVQPGLVLRLLACDYGMCCDGSGTHLTVSTGT